MSEGNSNTGGKAADQFALRDKFLDSDEADNWRHVDGWGWMVHEEQDGQLGRVWRRHPRGPRLAVQSTLENDLPRNRRASVVNSVVDLALDHLAAERSQFDHRDDLLNTPMGEVSLKRGKPGALFGDDEEHMPTMMTGCVPASVIKEEAPTRWLAFLERVQPDPEMREYLRRLCRYVLWGGNPEHLIVFLYGTGRNGKGVFTRALSGVMGTYAMTADCDTFTMSRANAHKQVLARMRGRRLVTVDELPRGAVWNDSRLKQMSGGDPVEANFMHQNSFQFTPKFTPVISGNDKPGFRGVTPAITERVQVIPFMVQIPASEIDTRLDDALKEEYPRILRWALDAPSGKLKDHTPAAISEAGAKYMAEQDTIGQFWEQECERYDGDMLVLKDVWKAFAEWKDPRDRTRRVDLDNALTERFGLPRRKAAIGIVFDGARLRPPGDE